MKGIIITIIALLLIGGITTYVLYRMDIGVLKESLDLMRTGNLDAGLEECQDALFDRTKDICILTYNSRIIRQKKTSKGDLSSEDKEEIRQKWIPCSKVKTEKGIRQCEEGYARIK